MENTETEIPPVPQEKPGKRPGLLAGMDMPDRIANIISWVLVPLLMPVYGMILILTLSPLKIVTPAGKLILILAIFGINVVLPSLLFFMLKFAGFVSDVGLNNRRERLIPYIIIILAMCASAWLVATKCGPMWCVMFYIGGAVAAFINFIINFKWKISAHAAGIAGIVALLVRIRTVWAGSEALFVWLVISIILAGLLGSARVWLGRHTVWQVLAGYAVGFLSVYLMSMIR